MDLPWKTWGVLPPLPIPLPPGFSGTGGRRFRACRWRCVQQPYLAPSVGSLAPEPPPDSACVHAHQRPMRWHPHRAHSQRTGPHAGGPTANSNPPVHRQDEPWARRHCLPAPARVAALGGSGISASLPRVLGMRSSLAWALDLAHKQHRELANGSSNARRGRDIPPLHIYLRPPPQQPPGKACKVEVLVFPQKQKIFCVFVFEGGEGYFRVSSSSSR